MSQHYYNLEGNLVHPCTPRAYPSATTILDVINKPELNAWRLKVGAEVATEKVTVASDRGTAIHKLISDSIEGKEVTPQNPEEEEGLRGFKEWEKTVKPVYIASEVFVHSKKYKYAGTADILAEIEGDLWVVDVKTSRMLSPVYGLQVRAYEQAWYEMSGKHSRMACLQLTNTVKSGYRWKEYKEPLKAFLAARTLFEWDKQNRATPTKFDGRIIYA